MKQKSLRHFSASFCENPEDFCDNITDWKKNPATGLRGAETDGIIGADP